MADTPPQFAGAAQSALAGMDAPPAAAAPVYQAPPAAAPPTFFGRILQGALNGLAGGLRQGQENVAGAGTPGFHPGGNGLAYAQQLQDQQDAKAASAQQQKQAQAQQDFENQRATFQQNQQAQLQQVQATQAKLNGIHLEQQIQHADTDAQDTYYKGQQDQLQSILDGGGKEVTHLKVAPGQSMQEVGASYLKDNPNVMHDPNTHITYSRDADGETEVHILSGDPNAQIDAAHANSQLKSIGSERQIAPGTSMSRHDFNRVFGEESGKVADQHNAAKVEQLKFQQAQQLESQRLGGEFSLEKMKEAAAALPNGGGDPSQPLDKTLETLVDSVHAGNSTPSQVTKGMGTKAVAGNRAMQARYEAKYMDPKSPDYDPQAQSWQASEGNFKAAYNDKNTQNVQAAGELYGTKDGSGKVVTQGAVADMKAKMQHLQAEHPLLFSSGPTARAAMAGMHIAGNAIAEDIVANAPEIAMKAAKFAAGGNPSSDAQFKATVASIERARTPAALKAVFDGIDSTAGQTIASMKTNPALARRLEHINDPGTKSDINNQAVDSQNPSGAPSVPKGMKLQRNRKTGETRIVPE